jgi:hypothetical protein
VSSSYAYSASSAVNSFSASKAVSSSYADTASFANNFTVIGNLTVFGTQSVQYITSSQLNVSDNVITVNVASPGVRFGGLSVFDSGSLSSEATASLFWDSQNNHWIYQRESGSTYDGGMLISGPRNAAGLGNELGTTNCMLLVGQGGDHLTSSMIYHSSAVTCVPNILNIGGALSASSATFSTGLNVTGNGGFFNAANKFGLDQNGGAARLYSNGADASTRGSFEFHTNSSNGSLDVIALGIASTGAATFACSITATQGIFSLGTVGGAIASVRNLTVTNTNGAIGDWAGVNFAYYNNGTNFGYIGTIVTSDSTNSIADMVFGVKASTATTGITEYMRIKGGGNVGIGTCNPAQALEVNGNIISSVSGKIGFRYSSANGNLYSYLRSATNSSVGPIVLGGGFESAGASNEAIRFVTNDGAGNERCAVSILNSGRVGIANIGPTTQFQIRKNYWQFWDEKSHGSNVGLFSIGIPVFGAAIVQIAGSRYSPGADNYIGFSTVYIRTNNSGAIQAFSCDSGTYQPSYYISGNSVNFCSLHAGSGTNYTGISVSVQASGHSNGSEAAVSVSIL